MNTLRLPQNTALRHTIEIKRSQFIAAIHRVSSLEEAREITAQLRSEFPDARHHCSASIISVPNANDLLHSSDDGEPSGTAGRPMLEVLNGFDLTDVVAVVIRYFGGTLLGTGGLVRAYSSAVKECLLTQPVVKRLDLEHVSLFAPHHLSGKLEADLRGLQYEVLKSSYEANGVNIELAVQDITKLSNTLAELTAGSIQAQALGKVWTEVPAGTLS